MAQRSVSEFPTEIIDNILHQIDDGHNRASFSQACRTFYNSFANASMQYIDIEFAVSPVNTKLQPRRQGYPINAWTSSIQRISVDEWASRVRTDRIEKTKAYHNDYIRCARLECRACTLTGTLGGLDNFLASRTENQPKKPQSLTFRGHFGKRTRFMYSDAGNLEHKILGSEGLAKMAPQRFEFNMHWKFWDMAILKILSMSQLAVLKLPLGIPTDCLDLGRALVAIPLLKSLTITDMADHPDFLELFPFLGLGIRSRAASMRDLDLSMTNHNRPDFYCDTWERVAMENEPFVKPADLEYFFSAIFPRSLDDVPEGVQQRYLGFDNQIKKEMKIPRHCEHRLKLEKLRLKRIDLPAYSFEEVIDGSNLRELRLPFCDVDPRVWLNIGTEQLVVLGESNYELLCWRTFKNFLSSQTSLQSLSFARPPDVYRAMGEIRYPSDEATTLLLQLFVKPSPLSQATAWGKASCFSPAAGQPSAFPSSERMLNSLSKTKTRNLLLPADMFDITPDLMSKVGLSLPFLQHLTWGFEYGNTEICKAFEEGFLPNAPASLRKITFLSLHLPSGYGGSDRNDIAFNAPTFHGWIISCENRIPQNIRYLRYRHLLSDPYQGERQETTVWYHPQEPRNGDWWIKLDESEGERMFEEERTPQIWPTT